MDGRAWKVVSREITSSIECVGISKWQVGKVTFIVGDAVPPISNTKLKSFVIVSSDSIKSSQRSALPAVLLLK